MRANINHRNLEKLLRQKLKPISKEELGPLLRGAAIAFYKRAAQETPQFSGHMVSNLTITRNGIGGAPGTMEFFLEDWEWHGFPAKQRGDPQAIAVANARNRWVNEDMPSIHDEYELSYVMEPDPAYYADVEAGNNLRAVNEPGRALETAGLITSGRYRLIIGRKHELMGERIE